MTAQHVVIRHLPKAAQRAGWGHAVLRFGEWLTALPLERRLAVLSQPWNPLSPTRSTQA